MCVGIDEAGKDDFVRCIERGGVGARQIVGTDNPGDLPIAYGNSAVLNDAKLAHLSAAPRPLLPGKRDQLFRMDDSDVCHVCPIAVVSNGVLGGANSPPWLRRGG